jgi:hypothetical protein
MLLKLIRCRAKKKPNVNRLYKCQLDTSYHLSRTRRLFQREQDHQNTR